jgi:hypothetical protein
MSAHIEGPLSQTRNHALTLNLIASDPLVRPRVASELRLLAELKRGRTVP